MTTYEAENNIPTNLRYAVHDLDSIHERVAKYSEAEAFGIRYEVERIISQLADIEARIFTLAGELRKAERLAAIKKD